MHPDQVATDAHHLSHPVDVAPHHHLRCPDCRRVSDLVGVELADILQQATRSGVFTVAGDGSITLHDRCGRCADPASRTD